MTRDIYQQAIKVQSIANFIFSGTVLAKFIADTAAQYKSSSIDDKKRKNIIHTIAYDISYRLHELFEWMMYDSKVKVTVECQWPGPFCHMILSLIDDVVSTSSLEQLENLSVLAMLNYHCVHMKDPETASVVELKADHEYAEIIRNNTRSTVYSLEVLPKPSFHGIAVAKVFACSGLKQVSRKRVIKMLDIIDVFLDTLDPSYLHLFIEENLAFFDHHTRQYTKMKVDVAPYFEGAIKYDS